MNWVKLIQWRLRWTPHTHTKHVVCFFGVDNVAMFSIYIQFGRRFGTPNIICKSDWHMCECEHAVRHSMPFLQFLLKWNWHKTTDEQSPISFQCIQMARTNVGSQIVKNSESYFTYTENVQHTPAHNCHLTGNLICAQNRGMHSSVSHGVEPTTAMTTYDEDIARWRQIQSTYTYAIHFYLATMCKWLASLWRSLWDEVANQTISTLDTFYINNFVSAQLCIPYFLFPYVCRMRVEFGHPYVMPYVYHFAAAAWQW